MPPTLVQPETPIPEFVSPVPCDSLQADSGSSALYEAFSPKNLTWRNADWISLVWIGAMHLGCLAAPFFFSWKALGIAVLLHWLTGSVGICLGYHRYLSHRSFKLRSPAEFCVMLCGVLAGQGSPLKWSAVHRLHHQRSDQEGDPHSPLDGKWWSHLLWLFLTLPAEQEEALYERYIPELRERKMLRFFDRTYGWWLGAMAATLFILGGWGMLFWAQCVRMVFMYHSTWFVNSATHLWGYRNYDTRDESRNLWWVAAVSYGEGWHNNHHAHPSVAPSGHRWWEVDTTWWIIKLLRFSRLATDVKDKVPQAVACATD